MKKPDRISLDCNHCQKSLSIPTPYFHVRCFIVCPLCRYDVPLPYDLLRPIALDPAWLTPTVVQLATTIYDNRLFDRMPVLADALEEAGCTVPEVLEHCRSGGEHVRGCWVVDKVLGKE